MVTVANEENFEELLKGEFVIVDFFSTTCGPCKVLSRLLENIEFDMPFISLVKVNVTDHPLLGQKYEIDAVPTLFFMKNGEMKEREVGLISEDEIKEKIGEYYYA